jgi:two-component system, OmpR family, phosphate regulon sensor histidine kinase PhoR
MLLNPRFIAFCLALLIAVITVIALSFVPQNTIAILFIAGVITFISAFILVFYVLETLIFQEVGNLYDTIQKLKLKDFNISRKKLNRTANPLKKLGDELFVYVEKKQKEVEELRRLEQFRREFLADVSHELKTPIFAAQGFIHTLLDGAKDDDMVRDRFLEKAAKSLDGLDALVHDLVTLSQMEIGEIKMKKEDVDILVLTQEIFEQLEQKAIARKVSFYIKSSAKQVMVNADSQRIRQVMTNLIDNAIKYGKEGGEIFVIFEDDRREWLISIQDNGPGIASQHLSRIFERFYRVEKSRSRDMGGTGLGLAIVKHIINAHKSKISVTSKVDKGTTFSFKLDKI